MESVLRMTLFGCFIMPELRQTFVIWKYVHAKCGNKLRGIKFLLRAKSTLVVVMGNVLKKFAKEGGDLGR